MNKVWEEWNLRIFILLSMTLQIILIFFASLRKRSSNSLIIFSVWSSYLLADWAAAYCIGLISKSQLFDKSFDEDQQFLLSLWAPFLLLHLGGPDPITALALEDNALWIRHLLSFIPQVAIPAYMFYQTFTKDNHLIIPTILMFVVGIIKYLERTASLYFASLKSFSNSLIPNYAKNIGRYTLGPNYAKLMDKYSSLKEANFPVKIEIIAAPRRELRSTYDSHAENLTGRNAIKHAYHFFSIFKGLIVDQIFDLNVRNESRQFFLVRNPDDAMKVISIELNFLYDVLFTKVRIIRSYWGYCFRTIAASSVVAALAQFYHSMHKGLHDHDVMITFILMGAAISLEAIALSMLVFSDWTVVQIKNDDGNTRFLSGSIGKLFLSWRGLEKYKPLASKKCSIRNQSHYEALNSSIFSRRWSESMPAFNLLSYCLHECPQRIIKKKGACENAVACFIWGLFFIPKLVIKVIHGFFGLIGEVLNSVTSGLSGRIAEQISRFAGFLSEKIGLKDKLDDIWYVTRNPFIKNLWDHIFEDLRFKSQIAEDIEMAGRIRGSRGQWFLQGKEQRYSELMKYIEEVEYDHSILMWHLATELCYNTDSEYEERNDLREFCKIISDYMLYLLVKQATLPSAVAGSCMIRYKDTCEEVKKFFRSKKEEMKRQRKGGWAEVMSFPFLGNMEKNDEKLIREACKIILKVETSIQPVNVTGNSSLSVMFDACILSKHLKKLKHEKWDIMIKVWVEMLSYGASQCRPEMHAQLLGKGGDFNTFVWLLMAQLGLGEKYRKAHGWAKLIATK
ncbi:hypothetical protein MLD38_018043 [Melastoma candidum]|uniref:Uncharacterized protein n=1 Tax=Melastoma candidum TaxID=119954 RepID=A0ACB9QT44_9MYRT|nr:hypothetical protein MLD38_018043 [Melastoma candidum]